MRREKVSDGAGMEGLPDVRIWERTRGGGFECARGSHVTCYAYRSGHFGSVIFHHSCVLNAASSTLMIRGHEERKCHNYRTFKAMAVGRSMRSEDTSQQGPFGPKERYGGQFERAGMTVSLMVD